MRAVMRAVDQYEDPVGWQNMMRHAMIKDFGWQLSATKYLNVYRRVIGVPAGTH
jgi:glycogen synthase